MKGGHESIRTHDDRALWKLVIVLINASQIVPSRVCLTNRSRREVHDLVPVAAYVSVQLRNTHMRPISSNHGEHMTQRIGSNTESAIIPQHPRQFSLGNSAINVRDNNLVCSVPDEDSSSASNHTSGGERKRDRIWALLQIEFFL